MMPQKLSQSPFTLQQMSPRSQPWKMCRMNTATPAPGPSAGSSCQRWGLRTPGLAALLLLLVPGEQEHGCRLQEQVEKDSELKRGSCRQPGAHAAGGAGRAEGRGSLTEQPAAPSRGQSWGSGLPHCLLLMRSFLLHSRRPLSTSVCSMPAAVLGEGSAGSRPLHTGSPGCRAHPARSRVLKRHR